MGFDMDTRISETVTGEFSTEFFLDRFREKSFVDCSGVSEFLQKSLFDAGLAYDGYRGFVCVKCHFVVTSTNTVSPLGIRQICSTHCEHCPYLRNHQNSRINDQVTTQGNAQSHDNQTNSFFSPTSFPVSIDNVQSNLIALVFLFSIEPSNCCRNILGSRNQSANSTQPVNLLNRPANQSELHCSLSNLCFHLSFKI